MTPTQIRADLQFGSTLAEHVHIDIVSHSTDGFPALFQLTERNAAARR